jgi:glutathione S-transferase
VTGFRKAAKVPYPYEYASYEQIQTGAPASSKAMLQFNCAQRAHQNFNENLPIAIAAMLVTGLKYPIAAGALGGFWSVNRVIYGWGYTRGLEGGNGRYYGVLWMVAHYVLVLMSAKTAWDIAMV